MHTTGDRTAAVVRHAAPPLDSRSFMISQPRLQPQAQPQWSDAHKAPAVLHPVRTDVGGGARAATLETLLSAPDSFVSIQWLASTSADKLEQLKQRYPQLAQATTVPFFSQGQAWYLLLSGLYPDTATALAQLEQPQYQEMIRELWPWVRPLASLKKLDLSQGDVRTDRSQGKAKTAPSVVQVASAPSSTAAAPALPQGAYTIEWMRADAPAELWMLRRQHPQLASAEVTMLHRDGRTQYLLIQGRFAGRPQALTVLDAPQLAGLAQSLKPRLRAMASLKHRTGDSPGGLVQARADRPGPGASDASASSP